MKIKDLFKKVENTNEIMKQTKAYYNTNLKVYATINYNECIVASTYNDFKKKLKEEYIDPVYNAIIKSEITLNTNIQFISSTLSYEPFTIIFEIE